ncbi:MAG: hypothetical protein QNJ85_08955 [Gammaproteobacteria bacterium]|nr:hypothetical protein [Gammaproteobacteria bacterium]
MLRGHLQALLLLLPLMTTAVSADHDHDADLSWHLLSAGLDESRVSVYTRGILVGIFNLPCDLTGVDAAQADNGVDVAVVRVAARPRGLLVIRCNVGAHAQMLTIIDPVLKSAAPAYQRSGSYFARWEIQDDELWIEYDRACAAGISVECPDGFETLFEPYPLPQ